MYNTHEFERRLNGVDPQRLEDYDESVEFELDKNN